MLSQTEVRVTSTNAVDGASPSRQRAVTSARSRTGLKAVVVACDLVAVTVAMALALLVRAGLPSGPGAAARTREHLLLLAAALPIWLCVLSRYRLYSRVHIGRRIDELTRVVHASAATSFAVAAVAFALKVDASRGWLLFTFLFGAIVLGAERVVLRAALDALRRRGRLLRPVVIVGGNIEGLAICAMLMEQPTLGYQVVGFVDDDVPAGTYLYDHRPVLGTIASTLEATVEAAATDVILVTTSIDLETCNSLIRRLGERGIHVRTSCSLRDIADERMAVAALGRFPTLCVAPVRRGWRVGAKRLLDISLATVGLILALPIGLFVAIAIKCDTRGPVLFRQTRVGRGGNPFQILKFRTMVVNAETLAGRLRERNEADGPLFKMTHDPRITRVGRALRRLSIDEVPQLWNVLRGEMSLVGPRPALQAEMAAWSPELHGRLRVKPGVTGMWQVNGRSASSFEDYTRLDLFYVDNWSLWTDLAILAKTVPTVLRGRGAC